MKISRLLNNSKKSIALLILISFLVGFAAGVLGTFYYVEYIDQKDPTPTVDSSKISIHFPELGNKYTGDCTYIKAGDTDILIDAGSRRSSIPEICDYIDRYVTDKKLEYVIVTHAHEDHYAGFATNESTDSIFDLYEIGRVIDFSITNHDRDAVMYGNYLRELDDAIERGAEHYTAAQCVQTGNDSFDLGDGIELRILDSFFYYNKTSSENNYSVCTLISNGSENYLFTGDLESEGEAYLVKMNDLPRVTLYKAGHHGSKTSSTDTLLSVIKPEYVCVCCCAGSSEYTDNIKNQFPTQDFCDRIAKYTDRVYVTTLCTDYKEGKFTSFNGDIVFRSGEDGHSIECSGFTGVLCESDWFKKNRTCPENWRKKQAA